MDFDQKTLLITGSSSGYGLETARFFLSQGWNVIATMRTPRRDLLPESDRLRVIALDVTKSESIKDVIDSCGPIDVLVNNAGIGLIGALEAASMEKVREIFETNTFGVMAMTQAVIPQMRDRRDGLIINVTSSVTLAPMPLVSIYSASKMAVDAFTASLSFELAGFNVRAKLVQPGYAPTTRFSANSDVKLEEAIPEAYMPFAQPILAAFAEPGLVTKETDVAEVVWRCATDGSDQLRYPAGPDAEALARMS